MASKDRAEYAKTADRLAKSAPRVEAPIDQLIREAERVREDLIADRQAWDAEQKGLGAQRIPTARQIECGLLEDDARARAKARGDLTRVEARVARVRRSRLQLVAWIRNPARMIWAKHAELNAIAKARSTARRAELSYTFRQAWLRSSEGQAMIRARRGPALDRAADAARKRRTLLRKIKRMDKRIEGATRTVNDLRVARELGERALRVPAHSPDATRFIRDVGAPAREAVTRHPAPARKEAIDRLNSGRGRSIVQTLFPGG